MQIERTIGVEIDGEVFGNWMWRCRKSSSKNVQTLATEAGMSSTYWYQLERGEVGHLDESYFKAIEAALGQKFGVDVMGALCKK
jgi:transcriptional regulator with XRE-family HTH domain